MVYSLIRLRRHLSIGIIAPPILLALCVSCSPPADQMANNITFKSRLSQYGLFKPEMSDLIPADSVEIIEIGSSLFTDYAEKQRLIKIPGGSQIVLQSNHLPLFPEGSIIAKTFFYSRSKSGKRAIIETRLLILKNNRWNKATYRWNANQNDADLLLEGATVPITFTDQSGQVRNINYKIPSEQECGSCHSSANRILPIGPKVRNLNITIQREGAEQNQLTYLMNKGVIQQVDISSFTSLPNYNDSSHVLPIRAKAYFEMNCAHCHRPGGLAGNTSLNLDYSMSYKESGMEYNRQNIVMRMNTWGEIHMPKTGTTIIDEEGLRLISAYIKELNRH